MAGDEGQRQGGEHENDGGPGRGFAQKRGRAAAAEKRVAGPAAERSADVGALPGLEEHDQDERDAHDHMNDDQ